MRGKRTLLVLLASVGLAALLGSSVLAGSPWDVFSLNRVEADPNVVYDLDDTRGPWMIMACSFSGDDARSQAEELVLEIRKRYKLTAYVYEKSFDHAEGGAIGRGIDRYGNPIPLRYRRGNWSHEYSVLVGDFQSNEDSAAQRALRTIKYGRPDCLRLNQQRPTARNLASIRIIQQAMLKGANEKKKRGPMGSAFLTTNPILPKEYFVPEGIDKFLVELNSDSQYSLLRCPGKYTVQVAHFTGQVSEPNETARVARFGGNAGAVNKSPWQAALRPRGPDSERGLRGASVKATRLCEALRQKGYEAYEFHDRYAAIVTVGSFDSVGTPRADGKTEMAPEILGLINWFSAKRTKALPGAIGGVMAPQTLVDIPFDMQPILVEVPKRSIAADYSRGVARLW